MPMRGGRLRDTASIQRLDGTKGDTGQPKRTYTEIARTRCSVEPLNGKELFAAAGEKAVGNTRIRFRAQRQLRDLKADDRIVVDPGGRAEVFDIVAPPIRPHNVDREIVVMCVTV